MPIRRYVRSFSAALLVCVLLPWPVQGAARFSEQDAAVARVLRLEDERLALMPGVAAWKWVNRVAITDEKREQAVISRAVERAEPLGLSQGSIRGLFELQIALASGAEEAFHQRWRGQGFDFPGRVPSLQDELRPRLDSLTGELLRALYLAAPELRRPDFTTHYAPLADRELRDPAWTPESRRALLAALALVRLGPAPALNRIRAAGVLRVGTTGDYAPFSLLDETGDLTGADIELAVALANELGVEPVFIRTSWGSLLEDLRGNRFDLAVGGVSITPARAAVAAFSVPYSSGGKTIISRCRDARRFDGLAAVDRRGVRVVVNPGGTNEQYVREHLHRADIRVFPDNRAIFDEIRAGRADVMITDDVEVELQTRRHADLCRAFSGTLTRSEKAILMPRDPDLVFAVDAWLSRESATGRNAQRLERFLGTPH